MEDNRPDIAPIWRAVEIYLEHAYATSALPAAVQQRLNELRQAGEAFFDSPVLERDQVPQRYRLRLGSRFYPHMKLSIDRRPDGRGFLLRADTHDRHACPPPASGEYHAFCELMEKNAKLAQQIESAWAQAGLPTLKTYLREDLARRQAAVSQPQH